MIPTTLLTAKAAATLLTAGALVIGGTAAAYAGVLPSSLQSIAHATVGAPSADADDDESGSPSASADPSDSDDTSESAEPSESGDPSGSATGAAPTGSGAPDPSESGGAHGPDATGPAAKGLCTAHLHGGLPDHSTAGQALIAAAGSSSVDDYCATVLNPSATPSASPSESSSTEAAAPTTTGGHGKGKGHTKKSHPHGRPASVPSH